MPQYFKAMATVGMWGLYVGAWLTAALNFIFGGLVAGYAYSTDPVPMAYYVGYVVSFGFAFAGGFMMLVRKKME